MGNSNAYLATFWLVVVGCIPVLFSVVRRWVENRQIAMKNKAGETWLMSAAQAGSASLVKGELARGAEVNEKDKRGQTALMKAQAEGHAEIVRMLGSAGAWK